MTSFINYTQLLYQLRLAYTDDKNNIKLDVSKLQ